jgi:hypothetical protein
VRRDEDLAGEELRDGGQEQVLPLEQHLGREGGWRVVIVVVVGSGHEREREREGVEGGARVEERVEGARDEARLVLLRLRDLSELRVGAQQAVDLEQGRRAQLVALLHGLGQVGHVVQRRLHRPCNYFNY